MEKHCTTVYFLLKKTRKDKNGETPIVAFISVDGERASYYTGKKVAISEWDEDKQLVKGRSEKAQLINEYINQLRRKIYEKELELMEKGFMITASLLKDAVNDKVEAAKYVGSLVGHEVEASISTIERALEDYVEVRQENDEEVFYCFHVCERSED